MDRKAHMKSVGKIEEESFLTDLDQLEKEIECEMEEALNNDNAPLQKVSAFQMSQPATQAPRGASKFTARVQMRSSFFPGQTAGLNGKMGEPSPLVPLTYMEKRRKTKPANDSSPKAAMPVNGSKFVSDTSVASRTVKKTLGALLALGAAPLKLVEELGLFRYMKERQFNSLLRLEKSLGQGHEDAEQFLRHNARALKKKPDPAPAI